MPPHEPRGAVDEPLCLPGEDQLEKADALAEGNAGERSANADERRPEDDASELFVAEEYQPQPRDE